MSIRGGVLCIGASPIINALKIMQVEGLPVNVELSVNDAPSLPPDLKE